MITILGRVVAVTVMGILAKLITMKLIGQWKASQRQSWREQMTTNCRSDTWEQALVHNLVPNSGERTLMARALDELEGRIWTDAALSDELSYGDIEDIERMRLRWLLPTCKDDIHKEWEPF